MPWRTRKITEVRETGHLRMGTVDFGGVIREVCLDYVPQAQTGDSVIVYVGFAISRLDEEEAQATLEILRQIAESEEGPKGTG